MVWTQGRNVVKKLEPTHFKHEEYKSRSTLVWVLISTGRDPTHLKSFKIDIYRFHMPMIWIQGRNVVEKLEPTHFKHEEYKSRSTLV